MSPNALAPLRQDFTSTILRISCAFSLFQTRQTVDTAVLKSDPDTAAPGAQVHALSGELPADLLLFQH